ncbi:MAG: phage tail tip lysozyme [Blautia sp.]|nr:phage tail tip lysozyme [Blautia sp.]MCM1201499.1 phage tail tip lysozyme [Bacteroides fragilis]
MIKICLDAGHWGKYNRSPAVRAYYESDMVWKLHLLQKKFLEEYEGVTVITTRTNQETDKALYDRGMASKGCDLFLSDHSNAVGSGVNDSVDYVAVYHLVDDNTTEIDDISKRIAEQLAPVIAGVMRTTQGFRLVTRKSGNDRNGDGQLNDNYYGVLHGVRMAGTPGMILEHSFHTNTRMTNWLLDDGNLARLAQAEADAIAAYYGLTKKGQTGGNVEAPAPCSTGSNEETIWNFLKSKGLNDYAVAGIWGNLKKESGFCPDNLQNSYEKKYGLSDAEYTAAVDSGAYGNFIHDSAGYGLAQWTYWSRKKALCDWAKAAGVSIANLNMQLAFLWEEIQGYKQVMNVLNNAGSVQAASDAVMTGYEKPADQSEAAKQARREASQEGFDKYAGSGSASATAALPYLVRVTIPDLNIRTGPGTDYKKTGEYTGIGTFTIVEESDGKGAEKWGLLKSGAAKRDRWLSLDFATKVCS